MKHFLDLVSGSDRFKENIIHKLCFKHTELFRDAEVWHKILEIIRQSSNSEKITVYVVDTPDASDLLTLLILLHENDLMESVRISYLCFKYDNVGQEILSGIELSQRQFIQAQSFYTSSFMKRNPLERYFTFSGTGYRLNRSLLADVSCFQLPVYSAIYPEPSDMLIARNLTIGFNFQYHEALFTVYTKLVKPNGILVFGLKEGFSWCRNYSLTQIPENPAFYYNRTL
ncbi:MAG: hypothetical protein JST26_16715 [Bacteroidetes bacterium]|nr:hypothetical protein [Bacteroidota bacterium]